MRKSIRQNASTNTYYEDKSIKRDERSDWKQNGKQYVWEDADGEEDPIEFDDIIEVFVELCRRKGILHR